MSPQRQGFVARREPQSTPSPRLRGEVGAGVRNG
jgi:hypothetical protein